MTEDQLEQETLVRLAEVGYTPLYGPELAPDGAIPKLKHPAIDGHLEKPMIRRSREYGNPVESTHWIPAFAGMTGFSSPPDTADLREVMT